MDRRPLVVLLLAAFAAEARADRLGGNYRRPGDAYTVRLDAPAAATPRQRDPLLDEFPLPFASGLEAGRREAAFRGRPLLALLVLPGDDRSRAAADVLDDPAVRPLAASCAAAVVDGEKEEAFGIAHGVRTLPALVVLDGSGRLLGRAEGDLDAPRTATLLRAALRTAGPAKPSAEARALAAASARLAKARKAGDWKGVLAAAAEVEAAGREGPEREAARAARVEASAAAAARIEEARRKGERGETAAARRDLRRIAAEFPGTPEGAEAESLVLEAALVLRGNGVRAAGRPLDRSPVQAPSADTLPPPPPPPPLPPPPDH